MSKLPMLLSVLIGILFPIFVDAQATPPAISLSPAGQQFICNSGKDTLYYSLSAANIPPNTNVVIYQGTDSLFNPYLGQGDSIAFVPGVSIPRDTLNFGTCVKIIGEFIDACGPSGQEGRNEYIVLTSGNGFSVNNLGIDFSSQNNNGNNNHDININAVPCAYKTPDPVLIANLRTGSCNASNVIPASPGDVVPANAIVVVFTSDSVSASYSLNGLCNQGYPVYILQSACLRTIGAFTNAPRCDAPSRYRTTLAVDQGAQCTSSFTYDLCAIYDLDGTFAIRQAGTDTASVANNGIRRNTIDSCGGIDYTQLSFSSDTILKYPLQNPNVDCNTLYYLKAITHPNGSQPLSNYVPFKLICVDVNTQVRATTICSGETANVAISSTDPNATFTWTVSGGINITGESAGSGSSINQTLTNTGTQLDSVSYNITSTDLTCTAVKTVTIKVQPTPDPTISGNLSFCPNGSTTLSVQQGFDFYNWSTGSQTSTTSVSSPGKVVITVTQGNCVGKDSVNVTQGNSLSPSITGNLNICAGGSTTLTVQGQYDSVRWNTNATSTFIIVNQAGPYSVTAYSGGCSGIANVNVTSGQVNVTIDGDTAICSGGRTTLTAVGQFDSVRWNTNETTTTIVVQQAGTFSVTAYSGGCSGTASVNVTSGSVAVQITGNLNICANGTTDLSVAGQYDSVRWNTNETTSTITVSQVGPYSVIVYDNGCSGTASVNVILQTAPSAFNLGSDTSYCGQFEKILSTGDQTTVWSTSVTAAQITVTQGGTYIATITNACGSISDTIIISQLSLPVVNLGSDTTICDGQIVLLGPDGVAAYDWSTGAQTRSITVTSPDIYSLTITDFSGCTNTDEIEISLECDNSIYIPNAFSPNNDHVNDVFYVRGNPRNIEIQQFVIFNRWGEKVFEANDILPDDPLQGWDGSYKNKPAPKEVYAYLVVAKYANGEEVNYKGNITLLK